VVRVVLLVVVRVAQILVAVVVDQVNEITVLMLESVVMVDQVLLLYDIDSNSKTQE
jgi:hypothetical protein